MVAALERTGQPRLALPVAQSYQAMDPEGVEAQRRAESRAPARATYQSVLREAPTSSPVQADALAGLGDLLAERVATRHEAFPLFERLVEIDPRHPGRLGYAGALLAIGRSDRADRGLAAVEAARPGMRDVELGRASW